MKYMGSKSRIARSIVPILQSYIKENNIELYLEPFVGGANIIDKIKCKQKIGNDINRPLIALLNYVKSDGILIDEVSKDFYDEVKNNQDKYEDWIVGCVGFLASYNGRFFDGGYAKSGYEKIKNGFKYRDYYKEAKNNIIVQSKSNLFKQVVFECGDYIDFLEKYNPKNSLIYFDPPYKNVKQYRNSIRFDYDLFWNTVRKYSKNNICIVSELEAPKDFVCIWEKSVSRSIKVSDKTKAIEKLFIFIKENK